MNKYKMWCVIGMGFCSLILSLIFSDAEGIQNAFFTFTGMAIFPIGYWFVGIWE